jgi:UDP-N-acetylglucosamine 2-epimerase
MKIANFVGTRPEIIKMQSVMKEIQMSGHELIFIHTGQHYHFNMSDIFIDQLDLPKPNHFLNVKSASQGVQTGKIIGRCERILETEKPDIVLIEGDTNSALGAAIASTKIGLPVAHVEAGCRSFDKFMTEEINRVLISDVADLDFVATENCRRNLLREGIPSSRIFLTGHPIVDLIHEISKKIPKNSSLDGFTIQDKAYALVTIHRRENVSNKGTITNLLRGLDKLSQKIPLIFPCHPHTKRQIKKFGLKNYLTNLKVIEPVGFLQSLGLIWQARFVLTDSGGIQQEAAILGTPCITLRNVTEWVETVEAGINFLAGQNRETIIDRVQYIEKYYEDVMQRFKVAGSLFGEVGVSKKILKIMEKKIGTCWK